MTCVVGIADGRNVWMGADTCASDKDSHVQIVHPKVFIRTIACPNNPDERMIIGGCGMFRMMQLLEHGLDIPPININDSVIRWLTMDFADAVRKLFKAKGFCTNKDGTDSFNGNFLIGLRGRLYHVEESYQAIGVPENEYSAGSGASFAFGSLYTTRKLAMAPHDRLMTALEVAAALNPATKGPFDLLKV